MQNKYYFDIETYCGEAVSVGLIGVDDKEKASIIPTGTTIRCMDLNQKNDPDGLYEKLACDFDINFIFGNSLPKVDFYTVPQIDIFATDSTGGYWATIGGVTDISNGKNAICFINNNRHVFFVCENLRSFIYPLDTIGERIKKMTLINDITFYESKEAAKKAIQTKEK